MSIRRGLILGWMMLGLQLIAAGQNSAPTNQGSQTSTDGSNADRTVPAAAVSTLVGLDAGGADDTYNTLPQIPAILGGSGFSTALLSDLQRSNYLRAGLSVGGTYDDNALLLPVGTKSNTSETIFPNIMIDESTSRTRWTLGYAGGLTINQKITNQNQGSHSLNFDSQFRLSPHVNLRVAETFSMTTGLFDAGTGSGAIGSGGPNVSLLTPLATQRSNVTTVETNYHFALNDLVGASGSFYDLHFTNVPDGTQLTDSQTASASAFWLHRLFRRNWAGASYHFDRITFDPGSGESKVHSFYAVDTMSLAAHFTLTGFVGPQYSENQGFTILGAPAPQSNDWSVAGGLEGGWQDQHTSLIVGYSRTISDGGGVLGVVRLQNVRGNFRREIVPGWAVGLNASHGTNDTIIAPSTGSASSVNLTSAGASLERNVGRSLGIRLGYTHDFQQQFDVPGADPNPDAHRNRFFVTLSYQWTKPLGM